MRATTSSAAPSARMRSAVPARPTGTASTTERGPSSRSRRSAARAVTPVASPSSTSTTSRSATGTAAATSRYRRSCRPASSFSRAAASARSATATRARRSEAGSQLTGPSAVTAPSPHSGWAGAPILRATVTSSGAPRAVATPAATGTPPRARPSTTGSHHLRTRRSAPSRMPASARSANTARRLRILIRPEYPSTPRHRHVSLFRRAPVPRGPQQVAHHGLVSGYGGRDHLGGGRRGRVFCNPGRGGDEWPASTRRAARVRSCARPPWACRVEVGERSGEDLGLAAARGESRRHADPPPRGQRGGRGRAGPALRRR